MISSRSPGAVSCFPDSEPRRSRPRERFARLPLPQETPESIGFDDIPWPPNPAIIAGMIEVLNAKDDASIKTAYRVLTLRWHPDKFMSRWGRHVEDQEQRDRIRGVMCDGPWAGLPHVGLREALCDTAMGRWPDWSV